MHTYRYSGEDSHWEVIFDCGAAHYDPPVLRVFADEIYAAQFAHFLNGGELDQVAPLMALLRHSVSVLP